MWPKKQRKHFFFVKKKQKPLSVEGVQQFWAEASEIGKIAGDHSQIVQDRNSCNLSIDNWMRIGNAQTPPDLRRITIQAQNTLIAGCQHFGQPGIQHSRIGQIAEMRGQADAPPDLPYSDRTQEKPGVARSSLGKESNDTGVRPITFA